MDEIETKYLCSFRGTGSDKNFAHSLIQWTVNGVNTKDYWQFSTGYGVSPEGDRISMLQINDPVALRGFTKIKCTARGVSGSFINRS